MRIQKHWTDSRKEERNTRVLLDLYKDKVEDKELIITLNFSEGKKANTN